MGASVSLLALASCAAHDLPPSLWPPEDFRCTVEETELRDGRLCVVRRVRFEAGGLVTYATSSRALVDDPSNVALPVFDRMCAYQLVPACIRAFARELHGLGVAMIDTTQGERGVLSDTAVFLTWRAFGQERVLVASGRVNGPMAQILDVVSAHLPPGERLHCAESPPRPVVSVLRGVPEPLADAKASLEALEGLLVRTGEDRAWLLDAIALASDVGDRARAEALLERWLESERRRGSEAPFGDRNSYAVSADVLRRLLPRAPS
jgi:hypothetical protein